MVKHLIHRAHTCPEPDLADLKLAIRSLLRSCSLTPASTARRSASSDSGSLWQPRCLDRWLPRALSLRTLDSSIHSDCSLRTNWIRRLRQHAAELLERTAVCSVHHQPRRALIYSLQCC